MPRPNQVRLIGGGSGARRSKSFFHEVKHFIDVAQYLGPSFVCQHDRAEGQSPPGILPHWRSHMLRLTLSAVALAGVLVTTHPGFADSLPAATADHVEAVAATAEQPTPSPAAWSPSSDAIAPVGTGWG
jgi:hypothetical protein